MLDNDTGLIAVTSKQVYYSGEKVQRQWGEVLGAWRMRKPPITKVLYSERRCALWWTDVLDMDILA